MYYWTKLAEEKSKANGIIRKAGKLAYFGHEPLKGGMIAQAWESKGYVVKK